MRFFRSKKRCAAKDAVHGREEEKDGGHVQKILSVVKIVCVVNIVCVVQYYA